MHPVGPSLTNFGANTVENGPPSDNMLHMSSERDVEIRQ